MPSVLAFRRAPAPETECIEVHGVLNPPPLAPPLFILSTSGMNSCLREAFGTSIFFSFDVVSYRKANSNHDLRHHHRRTRSPFILKVSSVQYPTFAIEFMMQPNFSSWRSVDFCSYDMYDYEFAVNVAQPPRENLNDPITKFTYYSTEYSYLRADLQQSLLNMLIPHYRGLDSSNHLNIGKIPEMIDNRLKSFPNLGIFGRASVAAKQAALKKFEKPFQLLLTSRMHKSSVFSASKFRVIAAAEASRRAYFFTYSIELKDRKRKLLLDYESRSSEENRTPMRDLTLQQLPNNNISLAYTSTTYANTFAVLPSATPSSSNPNWVSPEITARSSSLNFNYSDFDSSKSSSSFNNESNVLTYETYGSGVGDGNFRQHRLLSKSGGENAVFNKVLQLSKVQSAVSPVYRTVSQQVDKYPIFGVVRFTEETTTTSEAEGLRELMVLVGSVYATWSRSVLLPLERSEFEFIR
ncbi:hypothetical protein HDU84_006267 [Entophlyctis sp. JEL0112]|nr:hypothetical protein HDU84_006267 [Entophlyctis sp. JEL0112]